jgi:hypothetical protein
MAVLKYYDGSDWEPVASALVGPTGATGVTGATGPTGATVGKILQVVRATDATGRSTTSTTFVDASISVTITPTLNTSAILLIHTAVLEYAGSNNFIVSRITDNSGTAISGAQESYFGAASTTDPNSYQTLIAYATPATTSAVTYKVQFKKNSATAGSATFRNAVTTGQLFAIEIGA